MEERHLTIRCACGWETSGSSGEAVAATQEHRRTIHKMTTTGEQALAMAVRTPSDHEIQVVDHPEARRYEAHLGDRVAGFIDYRAAGGGIVLIHTEVDEAIEGRGIGGALVRGALDDIRARGLRLRVKCPFVTAWLRRHPEYGDLAVIDSPA